MTIKLFQSIIVELNFLAIIFIIKIKMCKCLQILKTTGLKTNNINVIKLLILKGNDDFQLLLPKVAFIGKRRRLSLLISH